MRHPALWLLLALLTHHALAASSPIPVDHLSAYIGPQLRDDRASEIAGPLGPPLSDALLITSAAMAAPAADCARLTLKAQMKDSGPRLLLIDAGVIFFAGARAYLPVPNQRFLLREAETTLTLDALPLEPHGEVPAPEAPLTAARLTHQAVLSLARAVQHVEGDELHRLKRYVVERDGAWVVDTFLQNRDVMLARQMTWHRDKEGVLQGRLSRDVIRFALYAITSGYTMQEATDWLRRERISDMNEAIATARKMGWRVEYLLERARLNYKIFMPEHADFYFNRGVKAFEQGRLEDSLKAFEEASKRDASMVEARYNIGLIHYRMGKYNESNSSFLVAAGHPRVFPDVLFNRAVVSLQKGDKKNALRLLQSYMEGVKKDPEASAWIKRLEATGEKG